MTKNEQKVINFMTENPQLDFLAKEVEKGAKISKAGTNLALKNLLKQGLFERVERGKTYFYSVNFEDARIKEIKKLNNINKLKPFVKKITKYALRIILFGSAGRGENLQDSDFDLFVLTRTPRKIREILSQKKELQIIVKTPIDFVKFEKQNPVFSQEINNGIILWQRP